MKRRVFFERLLTFGAISGMSLITLFGVFPSFFSTRRTSTKLVLGTEEELFNQTSFITKHIDNRTFIIKKAAEGTIEAFDAACTHAGCPVRWNESDQKFLCKCHGGIFDAQGLPLAGPPKKPLQKLHVQKRESSGEIILHIIDVSA